MCSVLPRFHDSLLCTRFSGFGAVSFTTSAPIAFTGIAIGVRVLLAPPQFGELTATGPGRFRCRIIIYLTHIRSSLIPVGQVLWYQVPCRSRQTVPTAGTRTSTWRRSLHRTTTEATGGSPVPTARRAPTSSGSSDVSPATARQYVALRPHSGTDTDDHLSSRLSHPSGVEVPAAPPVLRDSVGRRIRWERSMSTFAQSPSIFSQTFPFRSRPISTIETRLRLS